MKPNPHTFPFTQLTNKALSSYTSRHGKGVSITQIQCSFDVIEESLGVVPLRFLDLGTALLMPSSGAGAPAMEPPSHRSEFCRRGLRLHRGGHILRSCSADRGW
jgi:hypothetical protein